MLSDDEKTILREAINRIRDAQSNIPRTEKGISAKTDLLRAHDLLVDLLHGETAAEATRED
jgi:hypothetical protein